MKLKDKLTLRERQLDIVLAQFQLSQAQMQVIQASKMQETTQAAYMTAKNEIQERDKVSYDDRSLEEVVAPCK